jgi:hypothetical protein
MPSKDAADPIGLTEGMTQSSNRWATESDLKTSDRARTSFDDSCLNSVEKRFTKDPATAGSKTSVERTPCCQRFFDGVIGRKIYIQLS